MVTAASTHSEEDEEEAATAVDNTIQWLHLFISCLFISAAIFVEMLIIKSIPAHHALMESQSNLQLYSSVIYHDLNFIKIKAVGNKEMIKIFKSKYRYCQHWEFSI